MAATHQSQIETSIARVPETSYGTGRFSDDTFRRILNDAQTVGDFSKTFEDDGAYDAGSDLRNDMWCVTNDTGLPLTPDFCFQDAPYLIHDILGGYSVSGPDGSKYTHVQTPQSMNSSRQLPSRTILKKYGGLGIYMFRSMVATNLTISGAKTGRIKMAAQYKGDGYMNKTGADGHGSFVSPSIVPDREWGYSGQINPSIRLYDPTVGTAQVETATAVGSITGAGNATVIFTAAALTGSPITLQVPVAMSDTPTLWAAKVRTALRANSVIAARYIISGATTAIIATDRIKSANDGTLNISLDNGTCTGITTAASSAETTPGVVGDNQAYSCDIETWEVVLNNPAADEGYRACSPYLIPGIPESGSLRNEYLCGVRDYMFNWTVRMQSNDKAIDWMNLGTNIAIDVPIVGKESADFSTRIFHDRARIIEAKPITGAGGNFIGISGKASLMAVSGAIGLTITTVNDVPSYVS